MAELVGSIHQFLNNCKDTIVSWCKDAAKTVCLPLTGGSINGTVKNTLSSDIVQPEQKVEFTQFEGNMGSNDFWRIAVGISPYENPGADSGYSYISLDISDDNNEQLLVRRYTGTNTWLETNIKKILTLLDANGNSIFPGSITATAVLTTGDSTSKTQALTDNSTKIATTAWVNQVLANMTKGYNTSNGTRYIKFPNGLMICAGYAANVTAGSVVNFPAAFKNMPDVVIVRHWGGTGDSTVGASSTVGSAPVQVYNTTVSSFRVGVHTATAADSTAYINGSYTIYAMWIAVGEWK